MKKYRSAIIISIALLIVGYFININFNPFYIKMEKLKNEMRKHHLVKKENTLSGEILDFFVERGATFVTLQDGNKVVFPVSRNGLYENNFIGDFLMNGDFVRKSAGSDTLQVTRDDIAYYFVIGKIINED